MSIEQHKIDTDFGKFILEQYKIRKGLNILFQKDDKCADLICSKYKEVIIISEHEPVFEPEKKSQIHLEEFERVLRELKRREELIQELLSKLEACESTPKESGKISANLSENQNLVSYSEKNIEKDKTQYSILEKNARNQHLHLWRSILNTLTINNLKNSECLKVEQVGSINTKCRHEILLNIYKKELLLLFEENKKFKDVL